MLYSIVTIIITSIVLVLPETSSLRLVVGASSGRCGHARAVQVPYRTLRYTGASIVRYAMRGQQKGAQERRREGGTRERGTGRKRSLGLLVVRQQELG